MTKPNEIKSETNEIKSETKTTKMIIWYKLNDQEGCSYISIENDAIMEDLKQAILPANQTQQRKREQQQSVASPLASSLDACAPSPSYCSLYTTDWAPLDNGDKVILVETSRDRPLLVLTNNPFRAFPDEIMKQIVRFMNTKCSIHDFVRFASCDRHLQKVIYDRMPFIWQHVDLSRYSSGTQIDDRLLHVFLERIHARDNTRVLNLRGVPINGAGLLPLMGSKCLVEIHLFRASSRRELVEIHILGASPQRGTGMDEPVVAPILTSMLPYNLEKVTFRGSRRYDEMSFCWGTFVLQLNLKNVGKLLGNRVSCSFCDWPFSEIVPNITPVAQLEEPARIQCEGCGDLSCAAFHELNDCPEMAICYDCNLSYCTRCSQRCGKCNIVTCDACRGGSNYLVCDKCQQVCCGDHDCRNFCCHVLPCGCCERCYCSDCGYNYCSFCEQAFCCRCTVPNEEGGFCDHCDAWTCHKDRFGGYPVSFCDICQDQLCVECTADHQCTPPGVVLFGRYQHDYADFCGCRKVGVRNARGQTFICSYFPKKHNTGK